MAKHELLRETYCSTDCARDYVRCEVCGRFFSRGTEDNESPESDHHVCSQECHQVYTLANNNYVVAEESV